MSAALLFGASTPFTKLVLGNLWLLASLLYLCSGGHAPMVHRHTIIPICTTATCIEGWCLGVTG